MSGAKMMPGSAVTVRLDWPETRGPVHLRTPHYLRGRQGKVVRYLGAFPNPEDLAFGRPAQTRALYHVAFPMAAVWPADAGGGDELVVELYEHWLEAAA